MTLLEKAKAIGTAGSHVHCPRAEEIDLALAFLRGEVSHPQMAGALGKKTGAIASFVVYALRGAIRHGMVEIRTVEERRNSE